VSEYQYYEWQTVDRLLTEEEQEAVGRLSSHIEVSSSQAVVTYAWGDFKHDPRQVLARFFDVHLYMANWGSRRLMFRFPAALLSREAIEPYCIQDRITFKTAGGFDTLDMDLSEEEGGGAWIEGEGSLSGLIPLRADILQGDHRALYLAWLKAMSLSGDEPSRGRKSTAAKPLEPVVPPGLKQLSPALKRFLEQFDVPPCLVEAAAEVSPKLTETPETDFHPLVAQLARGECDGFLCRVARGDTAVGMEVRKRMLSLMPRQPAAPEVRRSIGELLKRADAIETARSRRQKEAARKKHEAEMESLAGREAETWQQVASLVDRKQTKSYDEAVQLLGKLRQLAEFRGSRDDFRQRVNDLCGRYKRLSGFKWRVQQAKLLDDPQDRPFDEAAQ
jgi:hypothetical protein